MPKSELKVIVAYCTAHLKKVSQQKSVYYWLELISCPTLTKKYIQLTGQKAPLLRGQFPAYLFNEKTRFVPSLKIGSVYCWFYMVKTQFQRSKKKKYYQIQDWKLLGDKRTVERSWRCLVKQPKKTN